MRRVHVDQYSLCFLIVQGFMAGMKRDCGGAAGILGAFATAVKLVRLLPCALVIS